jgi:hypothetical protein
MHGFELNEAVRSGELHTTKVRGWYYDAERDITAPALRGFVDDFYAKKEGEKDKVLRFMYKLILNSISGKFIQTRKRGSHALTDVSNDTTQSANDLVAGGMFHPFIASGITAHTRSRIHQLEHKYKALHTATDGIFTQAKRLPPVKKSLGHVGPDASGDLLLIRNKCYILYSDDGTQDSRAFEGKRISKYALHGFQGTVYDLERLIATNKRKYVVNRPHRLKESIKAGTQVNLFTEREYTLRVGPIKVVS